MYIDWDKCSSDGEFLWKAWQGGPEVLTYDEPRCVPFSLLKATELDFEEDRVQLALNIEAAKRRDAYRESLPLLEQMHLDAMDLNSLTPTLEQCFFARSSFEESNPQYGMSIKALRANKVTYDVIEVNPEDDFGIMIEDAYGGPGQLKCGQVLHLNHQDLETRKANPWGILLYIAKIEMGELGHVLYLVPCDLIDWEKLPVVFVPYPFIICLNQFVTLS